MADTVIFIAFAKEDEAVRNLFIGQQRIHSGKPFSFVDMSVKEPHTTEWEQRLRERIRRSNGVVALISSNTERAIGQLWEIKCAAEENKPLLGLWIQPGYRGKPSEMGAAPCKAWTWENIGAFIDSLDEGRVG